MKETLAVTAPTHNRRVCAFKDKLYFYEYQCFDVSFEFLSRLLWVAAKRYGQG